MGSHSSRKDSEADSVERRETFQKLVDRAGKLSGDRLEAMRLRIAETLPLDDQLRFVIATCGDSQSTLAARAGVDAGVLSRFMNYERDMRLATAARIAETLGLSLHSQE
ncbi:helix-turn-helix domain-containing protein [bacterium]|nr:helix-turn-helix domain-containing protein [bacterium]